MTRPYLILAGANFFLMMGMAVFVLLPHYLMLRGASESFYGGVSGAAGLASFASAFLLGRMGDRWDRKRALTLYLLSAVAGGVLAIAAMGSAPLWYLGVRALQGFAIGLGFPLVVAWVVEVSPARRRTEAIAYFGLTSLVAGTLGPLCGETLLAWQGPAPGAAGYRLVFAMSLAAVLAGLGLIQLLPPPPPAPAGAAAPVGFLRLLRRPATRLVLAVVFNFGGVSFVLMFFGKTYAAHLGLEYATVLFGAFTTGAVGSRIFIRAILTRISESALIVAALVGIALSFALAAAAQGYAGLAAAGLVYGLSHGVLYPALNVRFLDFFSAREMGRASTLYSAAFSLGGAVYPFLGGLLLERTRFATLFLTAGALALGALALHAGAERAMRRG